MRTALLLGATGVSLLLACSASLGPVGEAAGGPSGCPLAIVEPVDGAVTAARSVHVTGTVCDGTIEAVEVGGETVAVAAGAFEATVRLEDGPNELHARAAGADVSVVVTRDATAPALAVTEPARGAFLALGEEDTVTVAGRADDATPVTVTVNGHAAPVDAAGSFRFVDDDARPGVHTYDVQAEDAAGNLAAVSLSVMRGTFADGPVEDAMVGAVAPDALDALAGVLGAQIAAIDLEGIALADNPIGESALGVLTVERLQRGPVEVEIAPTPDGLATTVWIEDVEVAVHHEGLVDADAVATADAVVLEALVDLSPDAAGLLAATVLDTDATLEGFDLTLVGIPGEESLQDTIGDFIAEQLDQALRERLPGLLEEQLGGLDLAWDLPVSGTTVSVALALSEVASSWAGLRARAAATIAGADAGVAPRSPGSLRTPAAPPTPDGRGVETAVSDDLANAVLHAAWRAGFLDRPVALGDDGDGGGVTVGTLTLLVPALEGLAPADAPVQAVLDPQLPPVLELREDGEAHLVVGELLVRLEALTDAGPTVLATLAARFDALLSIDFGAGDTFTLAIADWTVAAQPIEPVPGVPTGPAFQELLDAALAMAGPSFAEPLANAPLATLAGLPLATPAAGAEGTDWVTLRLDVR